ncbi:MAG: site-specific DNA-methyltransferase [Tannerella sp.]|jgi:DNA modification methylase|nr:site-specific DNA-methyltransferase [Tannerella sp.]
MNKIRIQLNTIHNTDCLSGLKLLPDNSVNCGVTSIPYYGLRDYGTATWVGGNPNCAHSDRNETNIDSQIGLEETPEAYVFRIVEVFMEVHRVLKSTGTLWLNIGDSYWGGKGYGGSSAGIYQYERRKANKSITRECSNFGGPGTIRPTDRKHEYIKPKDLIGIPWTIALALRNAGWYLRQDIIWHKPNPMPESVKDRCTKSHEYIFLLTKSRKYYFDFKAILEPTADGKSTRHKRDVWTVCTKAEKENHFAVFPEALIVDCIKAGCPENGIVLDPFMGSGTTAVVARKLNRNYIGFELNPEYIEIANRRLNRELGMFK